MANAEPTPISAMLRPANAAVRASRPEAAPAVPSRPDLRLTSFLAAGTPTDASGAAQLRPAISGPASPWPPPAPAVAATALRLRAPARQPDLAAPVAADLPPTPPSAIAPPPPPAPATPAAPAGPAVTTAPWPAPAPPTALMLQTPRGDSLVPIRPPAHPTGLTHDQLVVHRRDRPHSGWRALLFALTGGLINPGLSRRERELAGLQALIRTPLRGVGHRIAVIGGKGGVGRSTVAAGLAAALAEIRGDQIVAVDASPEAGTLADRLVGPSPVTIRELLRRLDNSTQPPTLPELDSYLRLAGRLRVLAAQLDPTAATSLTPAEYQQVMQLLGQHIGIAVTDCSTGPAHPLTRSVLQSADALVIVGTLTVDGASRAAHTFDWLVNHDHQARAADSVVVLTGDHRSREIDLDAVRNHFGARARALVQIPYDPHLAAGGRFNPSLLRRSTRDAFTQLTAAVASQFAGPLALT